MNILIIDNSVAFTGAFKCALNEATILSGKHQFIFILPSKSLLVSALQDKDFKVYTLPLKEINKSVQGILLYPVYLFKNLFALKKIIRKENIDIVQVNDFYNLLGAALKISGSKIKLITYVRFLPSVIPTTLRKIWTHYAQKYSDNVIAVSDAVLQQLPQKKNTIRIYDPVLLEENIVEKQRNHTTINCLYLANYTRGKGQEHGINAFAKAYKKNKNLRLKFVGGDMGLEKNKQFKKELEKLIEELEMNDVISFHSFNSNAEKEIKQAGILLNFSEAESFSMTCLEAAYYGTPIIATKCGGPEEIIIDNETGLLVEKKNVKEMGDAIVKLADDLELRKQFSEAGKKYVREKFSVENFESQFEQMLERINRR